MFSHISVAFQKSALSINLEKAFFKIIFFLFFLKSVSMSIYGFNEVELFARFSLLLIFCSLLVTFWALIVTFPPY